MKILIPGIAFALLLIFFVARLPRPRSATTTASPSPSSIFQAPASVPTAPSELRLVVNDIRSFRLDDPRLVAPVFSRFLDIPTE